MNYQQQPDPNQVPQQAASAVQAAPQAEQAGNAAVENYDVARWNEMTPEEQKKVMELAAQINVTDSQSVISFGAAAQQELARFSDTILDQIRNKDAGTVGESLTELLGRVQELDAGSLDPSKNSGLSKLFGGFRAEARKFVNRYDKMSTSIEKIIDSLEKSKVQLIRDITMLDVMYVKNLEHLKQLDIFIMAGTLKLQELNGKVLPALREQAARTGASLDAQKVKDAMDLINRCEKKIHDLKLTRVIAIQTAPQIRLIQSNDQMLVERIQSSILNTIPLWKNQIVISITLLRQQDALKLQKSVTRFHQRAAGQEFRAAQDRFHPGGQGERTRHRGAGNPEEGEHRFGRHAAGNAENPERGPHQAHAGGIRAQGHGERPQGPPHGNDTVRRRGPVDTPCHPR
jgi:uncharacterized protein YaaN involved in tellurite resistance